MLRKAAILTLLALTGPLATPALAEASAADEILTTLRDRGYRIIEDERTWLGRQRIIAEKNGARRELVFIPGTGEILRDYSVRIERGDGGGGAVAATSGAVGVVGATSRDNGSGFGAVVGAAGVESAPGVSVGDGPVGGTGNDSKGRAP